MTSWLLTGFSSFLLYSAFPEISFWPAAFVALVPFLQALEGIESKRGFRIGFIWGLFFFSMLLWWLVPTISTYGKIHFLLAIPVVLCLCCYLAIYPAIWALLTVAVRRAGKEGLWFAVPVASCWIVLEAVRSYAFSGFPWGLMAYSVASAPILIQSADIWSVYGVGFLIVFLNVSLFEASRMFVRNHKGGFLPPGLRPLFAAQLLVLIFIFSYGIFSMHLSKQPSVWASAVQASIDQSRKWDPANTAFTVSRYKELTLKARRVHPGLRIAVWPETSMPFYFQNDSTFRNEILEFAKKAHLFLLIGSPSYSYGEDGSVRYLNSAYLIDPDGNIRGRYDKHHLVPFGEYMPWGPVTKWARRFLPTAGDFVAGKDLLPLKAEPFSIGTMICFESIFPEIAREEVRKGANLLAVITNDAWFGKTAAPWQHADMAIFRAVENRRWLVRAANTGVSRIISPTGRVLVNSRLFVPQFVSDPVALLKGQSLFTRFGALWFVAINFLFIILSIHRLLIQKVQEKIGHRRSKDEQEQ